MTFYLPYENFILEISLDSNLLHLKFHNYEEWLYRKMNSYLGYYIELYYKLDPLEMNKTHKSKYQTQKLKPKF